jgi:hypothetical protein
MKLFEEGSDPVWRSDFLIENAASQKRTYCALRRVNRLYVRWGSGEEELYNLNTDPYELRNQASSSNSMTNKLKKNRARLKQLCKPRPPGYSFG